LGWGFLKKVCEDALTFELRGVGIDVKQQHDIAVHYRGKVVDAYTTDLLVEDTVLVELKAVRALDPNHRAQCINYLKATRLPTCLLLNFGQPRVGIMRLANGVSTGKIYLRLSVVSDFFQRPDSAARA
jgi:GxxExxY protein